MDIVVNLFIVMVIVAVFATIAHVVIDIVGRQKIDPMVGRISFKESMDLVELPIITFINGDKKFNFLFDTGASLSSVNQECLSTFEHKETEQYGSVYGVDGNRQSLIYVDANLNYRGRIYEERFQVVDLSQAFGNIKQDYGVTLHGILGNSFFQKYKYVLDFSELVAYSMV